MGYYGRKVGRCLVNIAHWANDHSVVEVAPYPDPAEISLYRGEEHFFLTARYDEPGR